MSTAAPSRTSVEKDAMDSNNVSPAISLLAVRQWPESWKAYTALASGFFMMFNAWGMVNAFAAFLSLYDEHLLSQTSDVLLSLIGSTESFLLLFPSLFAGRLLDARRHYYLGFTGSLLLFFGFFALSFTSREGMKDQGNYAFVWLTSGLMAGLGMTCFFTYSSHNVIQWFPRKKYIAAGITSTGAGVGGIVYPLTFKFLVARYGFPIGVRILSSIVAGTTLIAFVLGAPCLDVPQRLLGPVFKASTWIDKQALRNKSYTIYVIAVALVYGGFYSVGFHITEWAEVKGFGTEEDISGGTGEQPGDSGFRTFWFLTIMNGYAMVQPALLSGVVLTETSIIGRLASAVFATHLSNPITVHAGTCFLASLCAFFFWPFAQNNAAAIAFCSIFGILGGSMLSLPASGVAYLIPNDRQSHVGQWTGMMWSGVSIFALTGPLIAAALKRRYGMDAVGYWTGATMLVTTGLLAWSTYLKRLEEKQAGEKGGDEEEAMKMGGEQTPMSVGSGLTGETVRG
ncbi:MAG: hypothetical protein Q9220_006864 [cf. Caloplaca sp. 1 TL-2023]